MVTRATLVSVLVVVRRLGMDESVLYYSSRAVKAGKPESHCWMVASVRKDLFNYM